MSVDRTRSFGIHLVHSWGPARDPAVRRLSGDAEKGQNGGETFEVAVSETAPVEAEALTADEEMGPAEEI